MNWTQEKYIVAFKTAEKAHQGQKITGTDLPYLVHVTAVSIEVIAALSTDDELDGDLAIQCALLHDVLEDTEISYDEILKEFGSSVAEGVQALTKNTSIDKNKRIEDSLLRIMDQPKEVWIVKMADRITNLAKPPSQWGGDKINNYWEESKTIHEYLGSANKYLSNRLLKKIKEYREYLKT